MLTLQSSLGASQLTVAKPPTQDFVEGQTRNESAIQMLSQMIKEIEPRIVDSEVISMTGPNHDINAPQDSRRSQGIQVPALLPKWESSLMDPEQDETYSNREKRSKA